MSKRTSVLTAALIVTMSAFAWPGSLRASTIDTIWVNNSNESGTLSAIEEFKLNPDLSMAKLKSFTIPENGRGITVIGDEVYYTSANDNTVRVISAIDGHAIRHFSFGSGSLGSGLSAIAYDSATGSIWIEAYNDPLNQNKVYHAKLVGGIPDPATLSTLTLAGCTHDCDGLEFFNGKLISDRFDGGLGGPQQYDTYDLNGNLLTSLATPLINTADCGPGCLGTGIAYDDNPDSNFFGNFFVADTGNSELTMWDGSGAGLLAFVPLDTLNSDEDLAFVQRPDTDASPVPEPSAFVLLVTALGALVMVRRGVYSTSTASGLKLKQHS